MARITEILSFFVNLPYETVLEKYAEGGYLHLLIPGSPNEEPLARLRAIIRDEDTLRHIFEQIFIEDPA